VAFLCATTFSFEKKSSKKKLRGSLCVSTFSSFTRRGYSKEEKVAKRRKRALQAARSLYKTNKQAQLV
jgi:hypothetical protein